MNVMKSSIIFIIMCCFVTNQAAKPCWSGKKAKFAVSILAVFYATICYWQNIVETEQINDEQNKSVRPKYTKYEPAKAK